MIGDKAIISPVLIELARWMADYYCCPVETAMRSVLPQVIREAEVGDKKQLFARLARAATSEELAALGKRAPRQAEVLAALPEAGAPVAVAWLAIIMAANVWFIIWPNQKKALGIVAVDDAAKAKAARVAMLASRTNTVLSIPMLYCMVMQGGVGG